MNMHRLFRLVVMGLVFQGLLLSWASEAPTEESDQVAPLEVFFERIAVAPVLIGHRPPNMDETLDDTLSCPIDQICVADTTIPSDAAAMMMRFIQTALKSRFDKHVVPIDQVQAAYAEIRLNSAEDSARTLALQLGQSLSSDLVVICTVWRFRDRGAIEGFPDKPASVAFALYLVAPETGRQLWRGVFDQTQEFALQDMGKFTERIKMGLKWLSADQLAQHGVKEVFRTFPQYIKPAPQKERNG